MGTRAQAKVRVAKGTRLLGVWRSKDTAGRIIRAWPKHLGV